MQIAISKSQFAALSLITVMLSLTFFLAFMPHHTSAASLSAKAKQYCNKAYNDNGDISACVTGFTSGNKVQDANLTCNGYSGSKQRACKNGFAQGDKITTSSSAGLGNNQSSNPNTVCGQNNECDLVKKYLNPTINLLSALFGLIAAGSLILGGIQFSASEGDPQKAARAKDRIAGTILAVFAFGFLYAFLQFLIPGGLFNR